MTLRYLIRLYPGDASRERGSFLGLIRSLGSSVGASVRNPKWTSFGATELDVFVGTRQDFELLRSILAPVSKIDFVRDLNQAPRHLTREQIMAEGRAYFNSERFWECHESLELAWRSASGDDKSLLQGIILVCAAMVHHQKGEREVALGLLKGASRQLKWREKRYLGVDIERLGRNVRRMLDAGKLGVFTI